jgi:hypothetical protein
MLWQTIEWQEELQGGVKEKHFSCALVIVENA